MADVFNLKKSFYSYVLMANDGTCHWNIVCFVPVYAGFTMHVD